MESEQAPTAAAVAKQIPTEKNEEAVSESKNIETLPAGDVSQGGKVRVRVLDRDETHVPVNLTEFALLSSFNSKVAFWWSCGTLALGSSLALYLAGLAIEHKDPYQDSLTRHDPIVVAAFGVACVIAAIRETIQRNSLFHKIKQECGITIPTVLQRFRLWCGSWRMTNVQTKDSSLLLSSMRRVSPENAPSLSRAEAPRGQAPQ
jgi:hypothetical protein